MHNTHSFFKIWT